MIEMRKFHYFPLLAAVLFLCADCSKNDLGKRADELEERIVAIENSVSKINEQIYALNILYSKNILISNYKTLDHGYELSLSNGQVLTITFGDQMEGIAPLLAIDEDGDWVVSVNGGKTFDKVEGSTQPGAVDGLSPRMNVDEFGFWEISFDGGLTWGRIVNAKGDPISAKDGKSLIDGSYNFFRHAEFNEETGNLDLIMTNGDFLSIPVRSIPKVELQYMSGTVYAYAGKEIKFPATLTNVAEAVFTEVPDGWRAKLDNDYLYVTAPESGATGDYTIKMLALSEHGDVANFSYTFKYDEKRYFHDDFDGDELDLRFWNRHEPWYWVDWNRYCANDPNFSYLENGSVNLIADKYVDKGKNTYRTGAIETKDKMHFDPPFRVDCRARFTEMAAGVWFAIWVCPVDGYNYGEIDIMEKANYGTQTQHSTHTEYTIHTDVNRRDQKNSGTADCLPGVFNTYSVELTDEAVVWYINDEEVFRYRHIVHSLDDPGYAKLNENEKPYYLNNYTHMEHTYEFILDVALGGAFPGTLVVDEELPGIFEIDWVEIRKM